MAYIKERKKGSGRYQARVLLFQDSVTGKQRWSIRTLDSREEAEAWASGQKLKHKQGKLTEPCMDTLAAYGRHWLDDAKERVRESTWRGYDRLLRGYVEAPADESPNVGRVQMHALRPEHIKRLYAWLRKEGRRRPRRGKDGGLSPQTVGALHAVIRQILIAAFESGAIELDLAAKLRRAVPRERGNKHRIKALTKQQLDQFLEAARAVRCDEDGSRQPDRYVAFWHLLAATGMRPGEGLALAWDDVDLDKRTIRIRRTLSWVRGEKRYELTDPKTPRSVRVVALPQTLIPVLQAHRDRQVAEKETAPKGEWADKDGLVFTTQAGKPVDWTNLSDHWKRIMRRAELGTFEEQPEKPARGPRKQPEFKPLLPPYCLRHTHATLQLRAGVPVKVISERLGHGSTAFTMDVYADDLPDMQGEAADAWDAMFPEASGHGWVKDW